MRRPGAFVALVAVLISLAGCGGPEDGGEGLDIAGIQAAFDRDEPGSVTGKRTTLTGRVQQRLPPYAFVIAEGDEPLLVLAKDGTTPDKGEQVRVSGTVHEFDRAEVRKRLGADRARGLSGEHVGDPYLWAERIEPGAGG